MTMSSGSAADAAASAPLYFSLPTGVTLVAVENPGSWTASVDQQIVTVVPVTPLASGEPRSVSIEITGLSVNDVALLTVEVQGQVSVAPFLAPPVQVPPIVGRPS